MQVGVPTHSLASLSANEETGEEDSFIILLLC